MVDIYVEIPRPEPVEGGRWTWAVLPMTKEEKRVLGNPHLRPFVVTDNWVKDSKGVVIGACEFITVDYFCPTSGIEKAVFKWCAENKIELDSMTKMFKFWEDPGIYRKQSRDKSKIYLASENGEAKIYDRSGIFGYFREAD